MRFLFNGLPYFTNKLVDELRSFDSKNHYSFLNTYESKLAQLLFLIRLPFCSKVISMNGVSDKSGSLSWVLRFKKPLIMQWQGSDVLTLKKNVENKMAVMDYIIYAKHYTDAPWLQEELKELGIAASLLPYKSLDAKACSQAFESKSFLTYLGNNKEVFYGWNMLCEALKNNPSWQLYVVGSTGEQVEKLPNVHYLAWVDKDEMERLYKKHPIFIRLAQHDGYALSVMEALSNGMEVIWNQVHEKTLFANDPQNLETQLNVALAKLEGRKNNPNDSNIKWVIETMSKRRVLTNYIQTISE